MGEVSCPACGSDAVARQELADWFCPACGERFPHDHDPCAACGSLNPPTAQICRGCGKVLATFRQVLDRHAGAAEPPWLRGSRYQAAGLRRFEDHASQRRMEELQAVDDRRLEHESQMQVEQRQRDSAILRGAVGLSALIMALIIGLIILRSTG
jgi:hypothetical protein